jgi:hypothetical protein
MANHSEMPAAVQGKFGFLLTLSGGDGLLSHSAFVQATL